MGDIKARAKDVVRYEAFGDAGGVIEELVAQLEKVEAERDAALACIAEAAAKAWDEGRAVEKLAWEHAFDGHPVPEGEMCGECVVENPYRKAVKS